LLLTTISIEFLFITRFEPKQVPDDPQVLAAIEKALQEK